MWPTGRTRRRCPRHRRLAGRRRPGGHPGPIPRGKQATSPAAARSARSIPARTALYRPASSAPPCSRPGWAVGHARAFMTVRPSRTVVCVGQHLTRDIRPTCEPRRQRALAGTRDHVLTRASRHRAPATADPSAAHRGGCAALADRLGAGHRDHSGALPPPPGRAPGNLEAALDRHPDNAR
jgi:hypothetical protein